MNTNLYDGAPDPGTETAALHDLRQLLTDGPLYREYLLRHAAHLDRLQTDAAWSSGEDAVLNAAFLLIQHDRLHATWLAVIGPDSNTWATEDGALQYLRREWRHWWTLQNLEQPST